MTSEQLRNTFQSPFDINQWYNLLHDIFKASELKVTPEKINDDPDEEGYYLGNVATADYYRIGFFIFNIRRGSVANRRVGLRRLVRNFTNPRWGEFDAALVIFNETQNSFPTPNPDHNNRFPHPSPSPNPDSSPWRLSFISDIKGKATAPKRYTYVFGYPDLLYKTPIERFAILQKRGITFENLMTAFSVEALSDEFFDKYREQYADFIQYITGKRFVKSGSKWEEKKLGEPNDKLMQAFNHDEKKIRDYIKKMMGRITFLHFLQRKGWMCGDLNYMQNMFQNSAYKNDYLDSVLEPLFFGVLNTKPEQREAVFNQYRWDKNLLHEWRDIPYLNGGLFERDDPDEPESRFPAEYFQRLFQFFSEYNFTIDENDPNDAEVGVDPEMLGKIFENLLEDNKDKGAFYTPKEIVRYMCQESLIAYLETNTTIAKDKIRQFVLTPEEGVAHIPDNKKDKLLNALKNVKICDPAIGSGAFPMGLLNELLKCREALTPNLAPFPNAPYQNPVPVPRSLLKTEIIQNNIYGVDIEKGAVDIARLRFWLSIVVDEEKASPLPNLDYKIMQGNSLIESYKGMDLSRLTYDNKDKSHITEYSIFDDDTNQLQRRVTQLLTQYYSCSDHEQKHRLQRDISHDISKQLELQKFDPAILHELKHINLAENTHFFLWHTWFSDVFANGGFDIVIGNPPYVSVKAISDEMKKLYSSLFETAKGRFNLFTLFLELFHIHSKQSGVMCLIIPEGIYSNIEYRYSRELLVEKCTIKKLCVFTKRVFEASVDTTIILSTNHKVENDNIFPIDVDVQSGTNHSSQLAIKKYPYYLFPAKLKAESKFLVEKLMLSEDFDRMSHHLEIQQGIIYSGLPKEEVFADYVKDSTFKPILDGRDINRWIINWDIKEYDKYLSYTSKLHRPREERLFVCKKKILFPRRATKIMATIDTDKFYALNTAYICLMNQNTYEMEYLLAILNSKLIEYIYNQLFMGWQITIPAIESMPVAKVGKNIQHKIIEIVQSIIYDKKQNKNADISVKEEQLNVLIYSAFGLTDSEIKIIEQNI